MAAKEFSCVVCQRTSTEIPILILKFQEDEYGVCPTHFPILIHQPQKLVGVLPGAEKLEGHEH